MNTLLAQIEIRQALPFEVSVQAKLSAKEQAAAVDGGVRCLLNER